MLPIDGVDLKRALETADKAFGKIAEARLSDYLRGQLAIAHNLGMKAARLRGEADQADAARAKVMERITAIQRGDWDAVEPFELSEQSKP